MSEVLLPLVITEAGRAALINDAQTGTGTVVITEVALGSERWNPTTTASGLKSEFKRVQTIAGEAVSPDTIHITISDYSTDTYSLGEFGLYTNTGVLFAIYSQTTPILEKDSGGILLLAADIVLATPDAQSVTIEGDGFAFPPATETVCGIIELATVDEAKAGTDHERAITPKTLREAIPNATEQKRGILEIATVEEAIAGTDHEKAITPRTLKAAAPDEVFPGVIWMFAGNESQIEDGWQLCNGVGATSNGIRIPDLRNRFVVGAGSSYASGATGGSTSATTSASGNHSHSVSVGNTTLSVHQIPSHNHAFTAALLTGGDGIDGSKIANRGSGYTANTGGSGAHNHSASSGAAGNHTHTVTTVPPYYALAFIIKL